MYVLWSELIHSLVFEQIIPFLDNVFRSAMCHGTSSKLSDKKKQEASKETWCFISLSSLTKFCRTFSWGYFSLPNKQKMLFLLKGKKNIYSFRFQSNSLVRFQMGMKYITGVLVINWHTIGLNKIEICIFIQISVVSRV